MERFSTTSSGSIFKTPNQSVATANINSSDSDNANQEFGSKDPDVTFSPKTRHQDFMIKRTNNFNMSNGNPVTLKKNNNNLLPPIDTSSKV